MFHKGLFWVVYILFLLYSNDLNLAIKHSKVHYFTVADDTNLYIYIYILITIKKQNEMLNKDWKNLTNWHNANKISVNVDKTEMILFTYLKKPLDCQVKVKEKWKNTLPNFIS